MRSKFTKRSEEEELMDDLNSSGPVIEQTLRELETINKWLGGNYVTINAVSRLIKSAKQETYKIIDIGCGGGDMLKLIALWARRKKIQVELIGVDANPHVIHFASQNSAEFPEISYKALDIFSEDFTQLNADIITATLFTHHFTDNELVDLLKALRGQTRLGIALNDLHRHPFAYHSINILTSIFSRSPMVKNDAGVSVLRSFKKEELEQILQASGADEYTLKWMWAFRWQVIVPS